MGIIPARAGFTRLEEGGTGRERDHPRSRGVYQPAPPPDPSEVGSSPLARGLHRRQRGPPECGKDHPRSRGVYDAGAVADVPSTGSSPLARGLLRLVAKTLHEFRIIPARAGFTCRRDRTGCRRWDHPRSRGVYRKATSCRSRISGSSPLARGLLVRRRAAAPIRRIIPARAGFTGRGSPSYLDSGDHPRSRGVYGGHTYTVQQTEGSSPLARGLPRRPWTSRTGRRIIPARAGFTHCPGRASSPRPDHPRSRGVYLHTNSAPAGGTWIIPARAGFTCTQILRQLAVHGSSPLARGLRAEGFVNCGGLGIIPARAGFTSEVGSVSTSERDHPRSRGVYCGQQFRPHGLLGSSPLARGLR